MKRPKSKFSKTVPKYLLGGMTPNAAGGAIDMISSFIPQKQYEAASGIGEISNIGAQQYNKKIDKINKTRQGVSTGLNVAGDIAMKIPGLGTAIGLGLKGLGAVSKLIPFGAGKEKEAREQFQNTQTLDKLSTAATENAKARAGAARFQAPAYGKKGMKLKYKTKY